MRVPPRLKLNRFQVIGKGNVVYDQIFNNGVNIIAGTNGSGKSTIADLIFYGLGGDVTRWKEYSLRCDYTLAEIETNNGTITLKRDISEATQQPMHLYFGSLASASTSPQNDWRRYNYKRTDKNQSFSQVLFRALGIPEAISEGSSNITMNQILRLIYVDQMSSIQRIFKDDVTRDTPETRQAVSDLMCGIGGYELFDKELELREKNKSFSELTTRLRNLMAIAIRYSDGKGVRGEQVKEEIEKTSALLGQKSSELENLSVDQFENGDFSKETETERRNLISKLKAIKGELQDFEEELTTVEIDIQDSQEFIEYLEECIESFDDSSFIYNQLGQVEFEYCPSCFSRISDKGQEEGQCKLCGSDVDLSTEKEKVFAVRVDLTEQLRESQQLLSEREDYLQKLKSNIRNLRRDNQKYSSIYSSMTSVALSAREAKLSSLNREIGAIERTLQDLNERMELANEIDTLSNQKEILNGQITKLHDDIASIRLSRKKRVEIVKTAISDNAGQFLRNDLKEHSDFIDVLDYVDFDFTDDWMAINGKRNVSTSASGMVILKNSLFMGLFKAAALDEKFNYPRFILIDNIEDKGMVEERSQNFQRLICQTSEELTVPHQIIFTTSMLNPNLDTEKYLVGDIYTHDHRTLNID